MPIPRRYLYKSGRQIREERLRNAARKEMKQQIQEIRKQKRQQGEQIEPGTLTEACFHFDRKYKLCMFLRCNPGQCDGICPNWKTFEKKFVRKYGRSKHITRGYMDWYDLVTNHKWKSALIPASDNRNISQKTFG
jgi:superfamily I DNA/RNA helicase